MRSLLLAVSCLLVGVLGALGYNRYLGDGAELAQTQADLYVIKAELATATQDSQQSKSESDAMSAQIKQLTEAKDNLRKELNDLKGASPDSPAPTAATPLAGMAGMMKAGMAQHEEEQLLLLKARLHLTPEQEAQVKAAMDEEAKRGEEMAAKMFAGGKIDPKTMADLKSQQTVDQTLKAILDPEQQAEYTQMKADQKNSAAETSATLQVNQLAPLLQLSDSQKDQMYSALAQEQIDTQDPTWIKNNTPNGAADPIALMDAQAKAKEDALSKILTPDQMATYHQQAQSQLDMQKVIIQNMSTGAGPTMGTVSLKTVP